MKKFFAVILWLFASAYCEANVNLSLTLTGSNSMVSVPPPSSSCRATFVGDGLKRYDWEVIGDARIEGTGNSVLIVFNGMQEAPSEATSVEAKVTCIATYTDSLGLDKTIRSNQISIQWNVPKIGLDIEGEVEVLRNSSQVYHAKVTPEGETSGEYTWRWTENGLEHVGSGENYTIDFSHTTAAQIILNCEVNIGGMHKSADPVTISILNQNYLIKVTRKDYSGTFDPETRKITHNGPDITDNSLVFVHFNVDDDDESAAENDKRFCGWDYLDKEIKGDTFDDDLCDITIKVFQANGMENVNGKKITIQMPPFLKLWKTNTKGEDNLLIGDKKPVEWVLDNQCNNNEILNTKLFVEGVDCDKKGEMIISVGGVTRRLEYATCSVGGKDDQPTKNEREKMTSICENLVDCEWCIIKNNKDNFYYNCIAFAVDPYLQVFQNYYFENKSAIRSKLMKMETYPFCVYQLTEDDVSKPNKLSDHFFVEVVMDLSDMDITRLYTRFQTDPISRIPIERKNYYNPGNGQWEVQWYAFEPEFKLNITSFIESLGIVNSTRLRYVIYMNNFKSPFECNKLTPQIIDSFFTDDIWKNSNSGEKYSQCGADSINRKIIYLDGYHAARKASTLDKTYYSPPENIPPNWNVFASKIGDKALILHLEKQVEGKEYGNITKAYE